MNHTLAIIETPFAGDREANIAYLRRCMRHSYELQEIPFASHALFPQFLDDANPFERRMGINYGIAIGAAIASLTRPGGSKASLHYSLPSVIVDVRAVFYIDRGMSPGMEGADTAYRSINVTVEHRNLPNYGTNQ